MTDAIGRALEDLLVDAHGDDEQLSAFQQAFHDRVRFPLPAQVVGVPLEVTGVAYDGDHRRGLVAIGRRDGQEYCVSLADVVPGPVTVEASMLWSAYRRWCGMGPITAPGPSPSSSSGQASTAWVYRPLATTTVVLASPLGLRPSGTWDPAEEYWGEPDTEPHPVVADLIAAGPRPSFEMEQVIPGLEPDDWDADPVAEAAQLHRMGADRESAAILRDLVAADERCIDGWVHLANIAFDARGPQAAVELYDRAVAIGEQSLPAGFSGVLPWGLIDNRPFLRALHGLGLCAWRQRRWDDAERIFLAHAWLDGAGNWSALSCLEAVRSGLRWSR